MLERLRHALHGSYNVEREIGGGGMSRVFAAVENALDRRVVMKVVELERDATLNVERFRREIQLAAQLQHPHIVPVLAAGEADGLLYYTMPMVEGDTLRARLGAGVPLSTDEALGIVREIASALAYAHKRGIVHRDIKPENILLSEGVAMVSDFGIAKALNAATGEGPPAQLTGFGLAVGTPAYMAPEQAAAAGAVDARTDLYALGLVAYEMLTGRHAFGSRTPTQMIVAHATERPDRLDAGRPALPRPVVDLVARCLEKDPNRRPATADEVLRTLDVIGGVAVPSAVRAVTPGRRKRWLWLAATSAVAVGAVTAAITLVPRQARATLRTLLVREGPRLRPKRVLIAPLKNATGDSTLGFFGEMAADWISQGLSASGYNDVVDLRTAFATQQVVRRIPWPLRRRDDGEAMAEEAGAGLLVSGAYYLEGDSLRIQTRLTDVASGRLVRALEPLAGGIRDQRRLADSLRKRTVAALAVALDTSFALERTMLGEPPSAEAWQAFSAGLSLLFQLDRDAFGWFERAAAADSQWVTPLAVLAMSRMNILFRRHGSATFAGEAPVVRAVLARAARREAHATAMDLALLAQARAMLAGEAAGILRAAQDVLRAAPGSPEAHLNVALAAVDARQPRLALQALEGVDPDRGIFLAFSGFWHLVAAVHVQLGDYPEALHALDERKRRFPGASASSMMEMAWAGEGRLDRLEEWVDRAGSDGLRSTEEVRFERISRALEALTFARRDADARRLAETCMKKYSRLAGDSSAAGRAGFHRLLASAGRWRSADSLERLMPASDTSTAARRLLYARRAIVAAHLGERARALHEDSLLAALDTSYGLGGVELQRARIHAALGDADRALTFLRASRAKGVELGYEGLLVQSTSGFEALRTTPGWRALTDVAR